MMEIPRGNLKQPQSHTQGSVFEIASAKENVLGKRLDLNKILKYFDIIHFNTMKTLLSHIRIFYSS